jgi:hypothetical protein
MKYTTPKATLAPRGTARYDEILQKWHGRDSVIRQWPSKTSTPGLNEPITIYSGGASRVRGPGRRKVFPTKRGINSIARAKGGWWNRLPRSVKIGAGMGAVVAAGVGVMALHGMAMKRRRRARVMQSNPGFKRAHGMPVDGGIGATGDLTLSLRGARHR